MRALNIGEISHFLRCVMVHQRFGRRSICCIGFEKRANRISSSLICIHGPRKSPQPGRQYLYISRCPPCYRPVDKARRVLSSKGLPSTGALCTDLPSRLYLRPLPSPALEVAHSYHTPSTYIAQNWYLS